MGVEDPLEYVLPSGEVYQFHRGSGEILVGRQEPQVVEFGPDDDLVDRLIEDHHVVDALPQRTAVHSQTAGAVGLGVRIDNQHAHVGHRQGGREVNGRRGLADSALLVGDRYDLFHLRFPAQNSTAKSPSSTCFT